MAFAGAYVAASFAGRASAELEYVKAEYERTRNAHIIFLKTNIVWWYKMKQTFFDKIKCQNEIESLAKDLSHYINEKYKGEREQRRKASLPWYKRWF